MLLNSAQKGLTETSVRVLYWSRVQLVSLNLQFARKFSVSKSLGINQKSCFSGFRPLILYKLQIWTLKSTSFTIL